VLLLLNKKNVLPNPRYLKKKVRKKVDKRRLSAVDDDTASRVF